MTSHLNFIIEIPIPGFYIETGSPCSLLPRAIKKRGNKFQITTALGTYSQTERDPQGRPTCYFGAKMPRERTHWTSFLRKLPTTHGINMGLLKNGKKKNIY